MPLAASSRTPPYAIEVAAGVIFRDGKVLITRRRADDHLGGLWEFPGGKRQSAESFEQCLRRELREELGIEVEVGELLESITHNYPDRTVLLKFYRCRLHGGEPLAIGCDGLAWIRPDELAAYPFPPADARLVETLRRSVDLWR